jgi:DNA-binding XRE family transcriptional regulator
MGNATNRWLDALADDDRSDGGTGSDYKLAKLLGVPRTTISNYRTGRSQMDDRIAIRIAELVGVPPVSVVAEIHAERARDPNSQAFWAELGAAMKKARNVVAGAAVMMTALGLGLPSPAEAKAGVSVPAYSTIYTMRPYRRRPPWWRWLLWHPMPDPEFAPA